MIVESDIVRDANDSVFRRPYDVEGLAAASIDPDKPLTQPRSYLGITSSLDGYVNDTRTNPKYRTQPLTVMQPGNEFFLDHQPTNANVFSVLDNLKDLRAGDDPRDKFKPQTLSYMVVGFHQDDSLDPLVLPSALSNGKAFTNEDILKALGVDLGDSNSPFLGQPLGPDTGRIVCHGVLRNVRWDGDKYTLPTPSVELQRLIALHQPIAVGRSSEDALSAFLGTQGAEINKDAQQFLAQLSAIIRSGGSGSGDDVDQVHRALELNSPSWDTSSAGGLVWKLPDRSAQDGSKSSSPTVPKALLQPLVFINEQQLALDACIRERDQVLRQLYGAWWNAVSLRPLPDVMHATRRDDVRAVSQAAADRLSILDAQIQTLTDIISTSKDAIEAALEGKNLAQTRANPFGRGLDPTVLFAGVTNGWPDNFHESVSGRKADQIPLLTDDGSSWAVLGDSLKKLESDKFPDFLSDTASRLLNDFLEPNAAKRTWDPSAYKSLEDAKGEQGWFPLYIEWELEYYHIPFSNWEFVPDTSTGRWRWKIRDDCILADINDGEAAAIDRRHMSGRSAVAPHVGLTLQAAIRQFLALQLTEAIDEEARKKLIQLAGNLKYLSTPVSGFIDHLLTLRRGHYPRPDPHDAVILDVLGITEAVLGQLSVLHAMAPYGSETQLEPTYSNNFSPFKPVVHGQARFTRLTLVDKFGQIVVAVKPEQPNGENIAKTTSDATPWRTGLYPFVSSGLACDATASGVANTVARQEEDSNADEAGCQFFQLPPGINQPARLNVDYMVLCNDDDDAATTAPITFKIASEWDNPVWGWLVANYVDETIQIFDHEGRFIEAVALPGSVSAVTATGASLSNNDDLILLKAEGRLAEFIVSLTANPALVSTLFALLAEATDSRLSTAADFASLLSLTAAFGRPFGLADIGVSIELSTPPLKDTSLLTGPEAQPEPPVTDYTFQAALGNPMASFDGLVATFASSGPITSFQSGLAPSLRDDQEEDDDDDDGTLDPQTPIAIKPYFIPGSDTGFTKAHAEQRVRTSCIVDPVLAVHVYSGDVFPVQAVAPPGWAVEDALRRMEAFFTPGPLLVPQVPTALTPPLSFSEEGRTVVEMPLAGAVADGDGTVWYCARRGPGEADPWDKTAVGPVSALLDVDAAGQSEVVDGLMVVQRA